MAGGFKIAVQQFLRITTYFTLLYVILFT